MSNHNETAQSYNIQKNKKDEEKKPNFVARRVGAGVLASTVILGAATGVEKVAEVTHHAIDVMKNPVEYSAETQNFIAEPGDGLWNAAAMVENVGTTVNVQDVIRHISQDPANIEALKDGLQVHEKLVIPVSASPRR